LPRGYQPSAFQPLVCIPAKCKFLPRFPTNKKDMLLSSEYNKIHIPKEINVDIQRWSESQVTGTWIALSGTEFHHTKMYM
jgi:hypothetical protein